ncbi:hypothetical protein B0A55_00679 [Friedmanniomyces simplex]|uniref:2,4-dienoyl-CoA reductase [(3E)-enoyl-CoA-producing] n=1 Tax=Friedmanniomyces simplex TaxID=329884 RepID=A0A4U0Y4P3_9PEZI|nr:hypothetical protein B0A55_00679 [Friedmanniomyces simplex]
MAQSAAKFVSSAWQKGIFDGKVVFCTGGSGDICSAQVRALVYLGANACIVGRNKSKAESVARDIAAVRPGAKVLGLGDADVREAKVLEDAARACVDELGSIDFAIAGAAGNFLAPFLQLSPNAFRTIVDIDLIGAFNTAKATAPYLIRSSAASKGASGRIIFISSTTQYTGRHLVTHGASAKAGIDALSAQLAIELGPRGITSNVIAPGPIAGTEGTRSLLDAGKAQEVSKHIPRGRLGSLKDMSNAAVYLFSDAGDFVNGTILVVDGGAWRTGGGSIGAGIPYPESVTSDEPFAARLKKARL